MADDAVGTIVMSVDGQEYDCAKFSATKNTGNKPIPTMNRLQRVRFKSKGIRTFEISCSVVIPDSKDIIEWDEIEDARISIESLTGNHRETYIDCNTITVSDAYDVNGETLRDLSMFCLDYMKENI